MEHNTTRHSPPSPPGLPQHPFPVWKWPVPEGELPKACAKLAQAPVKCQNKAISGTRVRVTTREMELAQGLFRNKRKIKFYNNKMEGL